MGDAGKHARAEREATDQSLVIERRKTDEELTKRRLDLEKGADKAVADARDREDDALQSARAEADEELRKAHAGPSELAAKAEASSREDDASRVERAAVDKKLSSDRDARRRSLAILLELEREQTDDQLLSERDRADDAIGSRDDFLGMVSHDLRNMLNGMALSASSLMSIPCEGEVRKAIDRDAQRIQRLTARMNRLVGDLLDVVSIDAGRLAIVPRDHDVTDLLRETLDVFQPAVAAKNISLRADARGGPLQVRCDHERILQVLANLVGNAVKFTKEGGRIDIVVEPAGREIRFSVADTGAGIAEDKLPFVFERFWQIAKQDRTGHGLGLYISRCIIDGHGGKIWVDSRLQEGSTFHFTLPSQG